MTKNLFRSTNRVIYDEVFQAAISKAPYLNFLVSIVYSEGQLLETHSWQNQKTKDQRNFGV